MKQTENLYKRARKHNWDDGYTKLYKILENKNCDKGIALMMYWFSSPKYFTKFENEEECPSYNRDNYKFVKHVEKIYPTIEKEIIKYDPADDGMLGRDSEIIKSPIPEIMFVPTNGIIDYKDINPYS
ncbi:MAG: DUF4274 domain-containing protein [Kordia sp.]|uniref:DUF4274 domain-containing protein n=1 Tax=Kordia sp. TaxID=1965332 RepID=UPI00385B382B